MTPSVALLLLSCCAAAMAGCPDWRPVVGLSSPAGRHLNDSLEALVSQAAAEDCPPSGSAVLEGAVVRLRSGSARGPNGGPKGAGGGAAGAGSGRCWWELRAPGGALVCGLRVALLALRLPCDRGALRVADHLLCGGHLGTHSLRLPSPAASVPVHYSSVAPAVDDFEAVVQLEMCGDGVDAEASAASVESTFPLTEHGGQAVSDSDCGGLYPAALGEAVGLLSPGYPSRYPNDKHCLFVLEPRPARLAGRPNQEACFLDLNFVDFHLAPSVSSRGCESGDRLVVEGVVGAHAAFCGTRTGTARLALQQPLSVQQVHAGGGVRLRFVSDKETSATGFRVLATLAPCADGHDSPTHGTAHTPPFHELANSTDSNRSLTSASLGLPGLPFPFPAPAQLPQCCGRVHAGAQLFVASPGFPAGLNGLVGADCAFPVARLSPQICRLRLVLHQFLLLGGCDKHFLDVDGRRLCGCQSRGQVVSYFDAGETTKLLRYFRHPLATGGFIAEMIQEACGPISGVGVGVGFAGPAGGPGRPLPYGPFGAVGATGPAWGNLRGRSVDDPRDAAWSNGLSESPWSVSNVTSDIKRTDRVRFPATVTENAATTTTASSSRGGSATSPQSQRWSFQQGSASPGPRAEGEGHQGQGGQGAPDCCEEEQRAALGLGLLPGLLPVCGAPSYKDWLAGAAAWAQTVPSAMLQCPVGIFPAAKCRELRGPTGFFASPRYPDPYPNNARVCYRIVRYPEQCGVQVTFLDFELEASPTCSKDYVSLGGASRYCGSTLAATLFVLNFEASQYIDILFISDNAITARGFRASYRQTPCGLALAPGVVPGVAPGTVPGIVPGVMPGVVPAAALGGGGFPNAVPGAFPNPGVDPGFFAGGGQGGFADPFPGAFPAPGPYAGVPPGGVFPRAAPESDPVVPPLPPLPEGGPDVALDLPPGAVPESVEVDGDDDWGPYQASGRPERPSRTSPRAAVCGGGARQQHLALGARDVVGHTECVFNVGRVSPDICGVQILVERMSLDCRLETLEVAGRTFCGPDLTGRTVAAAFPGEELQVAYRSRSRGAQADFLVHFQQVADCLDLDATPGDPGAPFGQAARPGVVPDVVHDVVPAPAPRPACVVVLDQVRGSVQAPALEPRPPHHLSCSYVFKRRPGHCSLLLEFRRFSLAAGPVCRDSYLALRNHKYCGQDLRGSNHGLTFGGPTIEVPYRLDKDIEFADWDVAYTQLPC